MKNQCYVAVVHLKLFVHANKELSFDRVTFCELYIALPLLPHDVIIMLGLFCT